MNAFFMRVLRPSFERHIRESIAGSGDLSWVRHTSDRFIAEAGVYSWIALELNNPNSRSVTQLLELNGTGIVIWYLVDGDGRVSRHADDLDKLRLGRELFDSMPVIPLEFLPGESQQVYVGFFNAPETSWGLTLWSIGALLEDRVSAMMLDGLYFGLVFTLLLFCVVVYFNIRQSIYLFFALYLTSNAATVLFASGIYTQFLFQEYAGYGLVLLFLATGSVDFFAAIFSILLLRIHALTPVLFKAWVLVIAGNLLNTLYGVTIGLTDRFITSEENSFFLTSVLVTVVEQLVYFWTLLAFWRTSPVARMWFLVIFSQSAVFIFWTAVSASAETQATDVKRIAQLVMLGGAVLLCAVLAYIYRLERTERIAAQELSVENLRMARDIEQARANFISTVSHDLHGPVRAIGFFTDALKGKLGSKDVDVKRIEENVETVTELLDSLVRLSEANASNQLSIQSTQLGQLLYTLKNEFDPVARSKGLRLSIPDSDVLLSTDPVALSQVLRNLIDNGMKYTTRGFVSVDVEDYGEYVALIVTDSGRGISNEDLSKIFGEFYQVSSIDSEGVGLGLSIVARLTAMLGIMVNVSSTLGEGSRFELQVPKQFEPHVETKPITQAFTSQLNLVGFVHDEADDELTQVVGLLDELGVRLVLEQSQLEQADFLLVPGSADGLRWLNNQITDKWIIVVGNVAGYEVPHKDFVILPPDVDSVKLRSVLQRVLQSRSENHVS